MPRSDCKPNVLAAGVLVLLAMLFIFVLLTTAWIRESDFFGFYYATRDLIHGRNPYHVQMVNDYRWPFAYPPVAFFFFLIPALLPFIPAFILWDIASLLAWIWTLHAWTSMFLRKKPSLIEFLPFFLAGTIAPCFFSFIWHQTTIFSLFFATASFLMLEQKKNFLAGTCLGLALIKPQLMLPFALLLVFRYRNKAFICGIAATLLLSFSPFFTKFGTPQDLRSWLSIDSSLSQKFYTEEQGIGWLVNLTIHRQTIAQAVNKRSESGTIEKYLPKDLMRPLLRTKYFISLGFLALWIVFLLYNSEINISPGLAAFALAAGILVSVYSHLYDAVVVMPWFLLGFIRAVHRDNWPLFAIICALAHFYVALPMTFGSSLDRFNVFAVSWISFAYFISGGIGSCVWQTTRERLPHELE